jgi:hypothetical protein
MFQVVLATTTIFARVFKKGELSVINNGDNLWGLFNNGYYVRKLLKMTQLRILKHLQLAG